MFKDNFLFEKDFFKSVFAITLPIAMQNVISFGVNAMDSIMLGSLGDIAVSGANLGGQPFFLMSMAVFGLAGGGNVLISQYWGKGEKEVILNHNFEVYCKELEERNIEILEKKIQLTEDANGTKMSGHLKVKQSIKAVRKSVDF